MSQEKAAEIIDLNASRPAAPGQSRIEKAGEFLAGARQAAGLELEAVSAGTKVKVTHLEAIEQTRPDRLPALPYAVGFVKVYARFLDLDAEAVAAQFKDDIGAASPAPVELARAPAGPQNAPDASEGVRMASIFGILAVLIFAGWVASRILGAEDAAPGAVVVQPQQTFERTENLTPRAAPIEETAPLPEEVAVEESAEAEIPILASVEDMQSPVDARFTDADQNSVIDDGVIQTLSVTPPTSEIATEPAPEIPAAPRNSSTRRERPIEELVTVDSKLTRSVAPTYPDRCGIDAAALESVTLLFDVTAGGRTDNARVVSTTNVCFEKSALKTIKRWRFDPKTINGAAQADAGKTATLHFRQ